MNTKDLLSAGMVPVKDVKDGLWLRTSTEQAWHSHLRHTTLSFDRGKWRCNGLGIAGPSTPEELSVLIKLVFGE